MPFLGSAVAQLAVIVISHGPERAVRLDEKTVPMDLAPAKAATTSLATIWTGSSRSTVVPSPSWPNGLVPRCPERAVLLDERGCGLFPQAGHTATPLSPPVARAAGCPTQPPAANRLPSSKPVANRDWRPAGPHVMGRYWVRTGSREGRCISMIEQGAVVFQEICRTRLGWRYLPLSGRTSTGRFGLEVSPVPNWPNALEPIAQSEPSVSRKECDAPPDAAPRPPRSPLRSGLGSRYWRRCHRPVDQSCYGPYCPERAIRLGEDSVTPMTRIRSLVTFASTTNAPNH